MQSFFIVDYSLYEEALTYCYRSTTRLSISSSQHLQYVGYVDERFAFVVIDKNLRLFTGVLDGF